MLGLLLPNYKNTSVPCESLKLALALGAAAGLVFLDSAGGGSLTGTVLSGTIYTKKTHTEFNDERQSYQRNL